MTDFSEECTEILSELNFQDITKLVKDTSAQMKNILLPHETFSLHDSMAGIELMEPKMDIKTNLSEMDTV